MDLMLNSKVVDGRLVINDAHIMPQSGTFDASRNLLGRKGLQQLAKDLGDHYGVSTIDIPQRIGRGSSGAVGSFENVRITIDAGKVKMIKLK